MSMTVGEMEEAVALLTKVCQHVLDIRNDKPSEGYSITFLDDIEGLPEWWAKHKLKSEREIKIEKIASVLSLDGKTPTDELRIVARHVLDAIS